MLRSTRLEESVGTVLSAAIEEADADLLLVNPPRVAIRELIDVSRSTELSCHVRLFAAEETLKALLDDFIVASAAAELVEDDVLAVRTLDSVPNSSLLLSTESVVSLVRGPETAAGIATTDREFVAETFEHYDQRWSESSPFSLRTPPRTDVLETLAAEIDQATAADFEAMLDTLDRADGGRGLDEVAISLLVAANNRELLYDISKWGEDVGLASKATFSRTKTRLEENDLIETEKVPIDVGRPRLRLLPGSERLETAPIEEMASVARERLA